VRYPHLVDVAWDVVIGFLRDWHAEPYRWAQEIDVQVEIAGRLSTALRLLGRDIVVANYRTGAVQGFETNQRWSRLTCEPAIRYTYTDGRTYTCKPDIVMWDDIPDANNPPDEHGGNFPILWACEVKYKCQEPSDWDLQKLRFLVRDGTMRFGCWIRMERARAVGGSGIDWKRDLEDGRVWLCDAPKHARG